MVRINDYTLNLEHEAETLCDLTDLISDDVSYTETRTGLTGLDNCIAFLELEEEEQNLLEAVSDYGYFKSIEAMKEEAELLNLIVIDGVQNDYELARHLMFDINSDEELLFCILGCTKEAYEQLGSYVSCDDLSRTIDIECTTSYVNGVCFLKL